MPVLLSVVRRFLSTPSARRATSGRSASPHRSSISIHALREEGDASTSRPARSSRNFYPRPPRGGRRVVRDFPTAAGAFLSTPSARRATLYL